MWIVNGRKLTEVLTPRLSLLMLQLTLLRSKLSCNNRSSLFSPKGKTKCRTCNQKKSLARQETYNNKKIVYFYIFPIISNFLKYILILLISGETSTLPLFMSKFFFIYLFFIFLILYYFNFLFVGIYLFVIYILFFYLLGKS